MIPLYIAIRRKSDNNVKTILLDSNTDLSLAEDTNKWTVLHLAANQNDPSLVKTLLQYKAVCDVADKNGNLPLHIAATKGNKAICRILITANNSTKKSTNTNGETAGDLAAKRGNHHLIPVLGSLSPEVAADYEIRIKGTKKVNLKASSKKLAKGIATGERIPKSMRYKGDKSRKSKRSKEKSYVI